MNEKWLQIALIVAVYIFFKLVSEATVVRGSSETSNEQTFKKFIV